MSYLVGKKVKEFESELGGSGELFVWRIKSSNSFGFRVGRKSFCKCGVSDVYKIVDFNDLYHKAPPGFEYNKIEKSIKELHDEFMFSDEIGCTCGSEEFLKVSALCYYFCLSKSFLDRVGVGGGAVVCPRRSKTKRGRKSGFRFSESGVERVDLDEALARREWNKSVAIRKRIIGLFIEAEKEYCKEAGEKFNLRLCEEEYKKRVDIS